MAKSITTSNGYSLMGNIHCDNPPYPTSIFRQGSDATIISCFCSPSSRGDDGSHPGPVSEFAHNPSHRGPTIVYGETYPSGSCASISFDYHSSLSQYDISATEGGLIMTGLPQMMATPILKYGSNNNNK